MRLFLKLFFALSFSLTLLSAEIAFPKLSGRVVDNASLLSQQQRNNLSKLLESHEKKTTNQVIIVTLKTLQDQEIEEYGYQLGRHWGIGQKGKDNGVLLIVAPNERKVRIEVGYGLEGVLTDKISHDIIQEKIIPRFKKQDYAGGIESATQSILQALGGEYEITKNSTQPIEVSIDNYFSEDYYLVLFIAALIFSFIADFFVDKIGKKYRVYIAFTIATIASVIVYFIVADIFTCIVMWVFTFYISYVDGSSKSNKSYRGSSGSSSSSSSNMAFKVISGFIGGGGSFGGGGASGSW